MTTELDHLYQAIVANPDEDVPRLMYADEAEASDDPDHQLRARFIKAQFRLRDIGPRRKVVEVSGLVPNGNGFRFTGGVGDELKVGDRVDIHQYNAWAKRPRMVGEDRPILVHGVLVRRVLVDHILGGATQVDVVKAEHSIPYLEAERRQLALWCGARVLSEGLVWAPGWTRADYAVVDGPILHHKGGSISDGASLRFERGFPSWIHARWKWWCAHGTEMCQKMPITEVVFSKPPSLATSHDHQERRYRYYLTDTNGRLFTGPGHERVLTFGQVNGVGDMTSMLNETRRSLLHEAWPSVVRWKW